MADEQTQDGGRYFALVIFGMMDPRQHHPLWYRMHGLLSEREVDYAMREGTFLFVPDTAQFQTGRLSITCHRDRWQVATHDIEIASELISLAGRVFDELLDETMLQAFAIDRRSFRRIAGVNVGELLAERLVHDGLGVSAAGSVVATMNFRLGTPDEGQQTNVIVEPSIRGNDEVFFAISTQHTFLPEASPMAKKISLLPMLQKYNDRSGEIAVEVTDRIATSLARGATVNHGVDHGAGTSR